MVAGTLRNSQKQADGCDKVIWNNNHTECVNNTKLQPIWWNKASNPRTFDLEQTYRIRCITERMSISNNIQPQVINGNALLFIFIGQR
jgi:hypothetical protein